MNLLKLLRVILPKLPVLCSPAQNVNHGKQSTELYRTSLLHFIDILSRLEPNPSKYSIESILGKGAYGEVYLSRCDNSSEQFAIKVMGTDFESRELPILIKLSQHPHSNIIYLHSYFYHRETGALQLVLEYLPTTLFHCLKSFDKQEIKLYSYQLFRALAHLHGLGICHR
jgi:glycogen synthase kinase 3 beta